MKNDTHPGYYLGNLNVLQQYVDESLQDFAAHWVGMYGWRKKMRAVPPHVNLYEPQVRSG